MSAPQIRVIDVFIDRLIGWLNRRGGHGGWSRAYPLPSRRVSLIDAGDCLRHGAVAPGHARGFPLRQVEAADRGAQLQLHGPAARVRDGPEARPRDRCPETPPWRYRGIHLQVPRERPRSVRWPRYDVRLTSVYAIHRVKWRHSYLRSRYDLHVAGYDGRRTVRSYLAKIRQMLFK